MWLRRAVRVVGVMAEGSWGRQRGDWLLVVRLRDPGARGQGSFLPFA